LKNANAGEFFMKTLGFVLITLFTMSAGASDFRLSIYSDHSNLIRVEVRDNWALSLFYRLVNENGGQAQLVSRTGLRTTYRTTSVKHPNLSCELFVIDIGSSGYKESFSCGFTNYTKWRSVRLPVATDFQEIPAYNFDYDSSQPFQWTGLPAKALFEAFQGDEYSAETSNTVGSSTVTTRKSSAASCTLEVEAGSNNYSCWFEN
jgi:hypothetical protein